MPESGRNATFGGEGSCIRRGMDKMLVIPADRPRLRPWMLCLLMGLTALALMQMIAQHRHHAQNRAPMAPAGPGRD